MVTLLIFALNSSTINDPIALMHSIVYFGYSKVFIGGQLINKYKDMPKIALEF